MKTRGMGAALGVLALGMLGACAAPTTGVSVGPAPAGFGADGRAYAFAPTEAQGGDANYARVETLVRDELARQGYREQADDARYRLAIAYATRPAEVAVTVPDCGASEAACAAVTRVDGSAPFPLPFAGTVYRHLLTLRFVDRRSGATAYEVTSAARDRNPDPLAALPTLVRGALAKLPFDDGGWAVTLKPDAAGGMPTAVSIEPARSR